MTRAFGYWPLCRGSLDWLVMRGVLQGRWCHLLLFAWCLHSGCLLWWFFFFLWRSCWSSLQNSTSSPFLQDSRLAVSGCVPAASISSLLWWSTVALFLWSFTVYCWTFYVTPEFQSPFSAVFYGNCLISRDHPLTHARFCSCITAHFSLRIYGWILVVSFAFQFFFQIVSFFARVIVANSFLFWISSQWPRFDPSFVTFFLFFWSSFHGGIFSLFFVH